MSINGVNQELCDDAIEWQDIRRIDTLDKDKIIISSILVDGTWVILSQYGDSTWQISGAPTNTQLSENLIEFNTIPGHFVDAVKGSLYRYMFHGRESQLPVKGQTARGVFNVLRSFLTHLVDLGITKFSDITQLAYSTYVEKRRNTTTSEGKRLERSTLLNSFLAVEALYELSQYTHDPLRTPPWPDTSAKNLAGLTGTNSHLSRGGKTLLIPDLLFSAIFSAAYHELTRSDTLLDLRDALDEVKTKHKGQSPEKINGQKNKRLIELGWNTGLGQFLIELNELRAACYIIIASTSGCRNHELANLQGGCHRKAKADDGSTLHWMLSNSEKTDEGIHQWMIPEVAVRALRVMERWAIPLQTSIETEIAELRRTNPLSPTIAIAQRHRLALFLGKSTLKSNQARTLSDTAWLFILKKFCKKRSIAWALNTHQFRRKFANYVAHSKFGDLRYLREHFAHWSLDMSLGYAMDESWGAHFDLDLFNEIDAELSDIKTEVAETWIASDKLSGGYGQSLAKWRRDPSNLAIFKSHSAMIKTISTSTAIRSNGHAWCTADSNACAGNSIDRTRCGSCDQGVISEEHLPIYTQLYKNLQELQNCPDIGDSGLSRVQRDINSCRKVFQQLGFDPEVTV